MSNQPTATPADAQVIMQLYDLRRESEMRKARNFFGNFWPQSADEVLKLMNNFAAQENAWFRQVLSYWEMVASLYLRGALHEGLFLDTAGEMWFVFAKIRPYLAQMREASGFSDMLSKVEKAIEATPEGRERLKTFEERIAKFAEMARSTRRASAAD
jgi:hypothetical protein